MLSVVMLSVIMLSVVMLSVVMLTVVMLTVVMLTVIMPSVVAPYSDGEIKFYKILTWRMQTMPSMTLRQFGKCLILMWKEPVMMVKIMYRKKKMEVNRSKDMSRSD
jgi:hypothetical protein